MDEQGALPSAVITASTTIRDLAVWPPVAAPTEPASMVRGRLHGERHGTVTHVAIVADGRLTGLVRATDLMAADADRHVGALAMDDPPIVLDTDSGDKAAWAVTEGGESEVAVVDSDGALVGIIPAHRMLALVLHEHMEDLARISGFLHEGNSARRASSEPTWWRFWHRLPWLLVGVVGALLASVILAGFEEQLQAVVSLSFFVPAIVYLANAVGVQTQSIAVRGLSVGVGIRGVVVREITTGFLLGIVVGVAFLGPAYVMSHDWHVAAAVSVSLVVACALANVTALGMPWLIARFGGDPAFGSGPVATVIQDVSSIIVYLLIASAIVPGL